MANQISPGVYTKIIDLSEYLTSESGTIGFLPILTERGRDNVLIKVSSSEQYLTEFGEPNIKTFGKYYGQGPYVALQHLSVSSDLYVMRALPDDAAYSHAFVAFCFTEPVAPDTNIHEVEIDDVVGAVNEANNVSLKGDSIKLGVFKALRNMTNTQRLNSYFTAGGTSSIIQACDEQGLDIYTEDEQGKTDVNKSVLMYVRGYGRGDFYDSVSFMLTADNRPSNFGLYNFSIYQDQDGEPTLVESYNVSFDPQSTDADGESNFIEDVVNKYSKLVVVEVNEEALGLMGKFIEKYYKNDPDVSPLFPVYNLDDKEIKLLQGNGFPAGVPRFYTRLTAPDEITDADSWAEDEGHVYRFDVIDDVVTYTRCDPSYVDGVATPDTTVPSGYDLGVKAKSIWEAYCYKAASQFALHKANVAYETAVKPLADGDGRTETSRDEAIKAAVALIELAQTAVDVADKMLDDASSMSILELVDSSDELGAQSYYLKMGTLGGIMQTRNGKRVIYPTVANQCLALAYSGLLKKPVVVKKVDDSTGNVKWKVQYANEVLDMDWIYFSIVYDPGYRPDVKEMAKQLVEERGDCVLISDCGDNSDCEDVELYVGKTKGAADCRIWNSFYCARYEPYTRVYDKYTGTDQWFSPVYTMAKLIPQNDALYDIWYAAAGFNRGVSSEIKELRWSPNKGERDRLYLAQVNPIVYFPEGMTVFSQLTTQKKSSTLSDLNCVRTVLYIKRALEQFCKYYIFEFNDNQTHDQIAQGITPFLDSIVAARGLKSYGVEVGATDYEYKTKTCHVNVTLAPMKVIEKIQINMYIQ